MSTLVFLSLIVNRKTTLQSMADDHPLAGVEALLFDVFGTVVDWRGSVARELGLLNPDLPNEGVLIPYGSSWGSGLIDKEPRYL